MVLIAVDKFTLSGVPLEILSLAVFGVYLGAVFGHTAMAINKQKQTMWSYLSTAFITVIGYLIFIPLLWHAWRGLDDGFLRTIHRHFTFYFNPPLY